MRIESGAFISGNRLARVISELVVIYGKPSAIRLDNGAEMTSHVFTDWAKDFEVELRFVQPCKSNQNDYIKRFNRSFRTEVLDTNLINIVSEVQATADEWVTVYNQFRTHKTLNTYRHSAVHAKGI